MLIVPPPSSCSAVTQPSAVAARGDRHCAIGDRQFVDTSDEDDLMQRVGRGGHDAYRALVERYLARIVAFAARTLGDAAEAEDVAQETFLRLWSHAFDWQTGNAQLSKGELLRLTDAQRAAVALCHYQGIRNADAADMLGITVEALESLLARARRTLRERLRPFAHELLESDG